MQKRVVVTGGTSGIGKATVAMLLSRGYEVIATGLFDHELDACRADETIAGAKLVKLDVGDDEQIDAFFADIDQLDGLVNCAGIGRGAEEFQPEGFTRTIEINLNGTMRCCYAAKSALAAVDQSAIVNIASVMSFFGSGTGPGYSASKGAVVQFTKSLAIAWADEGIRVNAVAPGWIETPMTTLMQEDIDRNQRVLDRSPMKRWGKPEEIANGIGFLLSDQASFVNGIVLPVDGGYMAVGI